MNIVDVLIVIFLLAAIFRGHELGFVRQLFSTLGFFGGLLLGAIIEPKVVSYGHSEISRLLLTLASTLGLALFLLYVGELIGIVVKRKLLFLNKLNDADNWLGSGLAGISILLAVWLSAATLVKLPYPELQSLVRGSKIISSLNTHLPPAPNVIADIGRLVAPNGFPNVFIGNEPAPTPTTLPTPAELASAVSKDEASVVKIEGLGCGGIVTGSGFVSANGLVSTNAHVVAGIARPYIVDGNGRHTATVIWFDRDLDYAVLRATNLAGSPLTLNTAPIAAGTHAGVLGYPAGGPFNAQSAAVIDEFPARGRDIYNRDTTLRDVYSLEADVIPGNSGGPLVDLNGGVIGVVFATSTMYNNVGYALNIKPVASELHQAEAQNRPVSTGSCAQE